MKVVSYRDHAPKMHVLLVGIVTVVCLGPFLTKAFHIDDTLFLWVAKQILVKPTDFFGFYANFWGYEMPMSEIIYNPPLASYFIALVSSLLGWSELGLHLAFLIPAVSLAIGTYYLARSFCAQPAIASLIVVLSPAFLVSSTNIMTDTMMLNFYVWAVFLWLRGVKKNCYLRLLIASILIGMSALTKYFGITLVPLLFICSLRVKPKIQYHVLFLCIPLLMLGGYEWVTHRLYDHGLLSYAVSYNVEWRTAEGAKLLTKGITGLIFTGGCLLGVGLYAPMLWTRRFWIYASVGLPLSLAVLLWIGKFGELSFEDTDSIRWALVLQFGLFILAGLHVLFLAAADYLKNRTRLSLMLFLWIIGTFLFATFINWSVNARVVYPMLPAAAILVMRRLEERWQEMPIWKKTLPLVLAAGVSLSVTWADFSLANCQRSAARLIMAEHGPNSHRVWFQGHWGFQYYMESLGAKPFDEKRTRVKEGDIIVIPTNNTNISPPRRDIEPRLRRLKDKELNCCRWLGTMQQSLGAGFYSDVWGPLPFVFGSVPAERYLVFSVGPSRRPFPVPKRFTR